MRMCDCQKVKHLMSFLDASDTEEEVTETLLVNIVWNMEQVFECFCNMCVERARQRVLVLVSPHPPRPRTPHSYIHTGSSVITTSLWVTR